MYSIFICIEPLFSIFAAIDTEREREKRLSIDLKLCAVHPETESEQVNGNFTDMCIWELSVKLRTFRIDAPPTRIPFPSGVAIWILFSFSSFSCLNFYIANGTRSTVFVGTQHTAHEEIKYQRE